MLVCTTLLWIPMRKRTTIVNADREKRGWSQSDVRKDTCAVAGSPIQ